MAKLEFKFDVKDIGQDGHFTGLASVYDIIDRGGDIVAAGAFEKSLAAVRAGEHSIKMLWQHNPSQPIGVWDSFSDDESGLQASGRLIAGVKLAEETLALLRAGAIDGLSIGYRTKEAEPIETDTGSFRLIKEAELWEVSLVTFPMNQAATVTDVKNLGSARDVEHLLREAGVPNSFAKLVALHGFEEAKHRLKSDRRDADGKARAQAELSALQTQLQGLKEIINA